MIPPKFRICVLIAVLLGACAPAPSRPVRASDPSPYPRAPVPSASPTAVEPSPAHAALSDEPEVLRVEGSFMEAGASETFIVKAGGPTNGASGGRTGYLFRREKHGAYGASGVLLRTISSFPAEDCVVMTRPRRISLLLCTMVSTWNSVPAYGVALFDLSRPLEPDSFTHGPAEGFLRPAQTLLRLDEADLMTRYACDAMGTFPPLQLAPRPMRLREGSPKGAKATFVLRAPVRSRAELLRLCEAVARAKRAGPNAPGQDPLDLSDDLAVTDYAASLLGPPKRLLVRLALDASGERLVFEEGSAIRNEIEALGFRLGTPP